MPLVVQEEGSFQHILRYVQQSPNPTCLNTPSVDRSHEKSKMTI